LIGFTQAHEVAGRASDLKKIEDLGAILEEKLILDNRLAFAQFFVINTFSVKKNCGSTAGNFCIDVVLYSLQRASFSKPVILENLCGERRNFRKVSKF
jgi:hypothetical protein